MMKSLYTILFICLLGGYSVAQLTINPQIGINGSFLTNDQTEISHSATVGFQLGVNLRYGGFFYAESGVQWNRFQKEITYTLVGLNDDVEIDIIEIPLIVGVKAIPLGVIDLRLYTGVAMSFVTNVGDNALSIGVDSYNSPIFGWILGAGLDLTLITFDLNYEIGLSNTLEFTVSDISITSKTNVLRFLIGIRI